MTSDIKIKFLRPKDFVRKWRQRAKPAVLYSPLNTLCITAVPGRLIVHDFINEAAALQAMPWVKRWQRETFRENKISYHSAKALDYWNSRGLTDKVINTRFIHRDGKIIIRYNA